MSRAAADAFFDIFDMRRVEAGEMSNPHVAAIDPVGPASREEAREEARGRYPDVVRIAAGLAASAWQEWDSRETADAAAHMAGIALAIVIACEEACGIGGDA